MQRVAVYFNVADPLAYGCRLLRKVWQGDGQAMVYADQVLLRELDRALWSFSPTEFLAHCWADEAHAAATPIVLTTSLTAPGAKSLLVNLGHPQVSEMAAFEQVIDVVGPDAPDREQARKRWRSYQELGLSVAAHDMSHWGQE